MTVSGQIRRGAYFDSVTLMRVGKELSGMPGVGDAAVVMGTRSNKAILAAAGLLVTEFQNARDTDLLIAVEASSDKAASEAIAKTDALLKGATRKTAASDQARAGSMDEAVNLLPGANMAVISVAGRYAGDEAMKALARGLHVMLFSDNVPLEKEIELKKYGAKKGLLVMGPGAGTAIINGVPLAFANVVNRGRIGVVAAAGTGLQEVTSIITGEGDGISQAIGTGGRDVKKTVGGIMFLAAIKALAADPSTKVILLVSKPPDAAVLRKISAAVRAIKKPVVQLFLGAKPRPGEPRTLEEAAHVAVALARGEKPDAALQRLAVRDADIVKLARREAAKRKKGQRYVRGLFSGGTFCAEAQVILGGLLKDVYSNAPTGRAKPLKNPLKSQKHTVIDLGEEEFTQGRPHPMIDYSLRKQRLGQEANDRETAVILLDVVLGFGSNMNPAAELRDVIRSASRRVRVVCSVTGTTQDPQNADRVRELLEKAGAIVMPSNAAACKLAAGIARNLGHVH
ncbi:MAG: acyl-CoA synthetase FdrA [Verrucomicrobiota bacterium]